MTESLALPGSGLLHLSICNRCLRSELVSDLNLLLNRNSFSWQLFNHSVSYRCNSKMVFNKAYVELLLKMTNNPNSNSILVPPK